MKRARVEGVITMDRRVPAVACQFRGRDPIRADLESRSADVNNRNQWGQRDAWRAARFDPQS